MKPSFRKFAVLSLLGACAAPGWMAAALPSETEPLPLAPADAGAKAPSIRSLRHATAVAWVEQEGEELPKVRYTTFKDTLLTPGTSVTIRTVSSSGDGIPSDPDIAIDPATLKASLAWVFSSPNRDCIEFQSPGAEAETVHETANVLELPSIEYDQQGNVYLAWSEIQGGQSSVTAATRGKNGAWNIVALSDAARPYDVSPQLFGGKQSAELYWFSIGGAGVSPRQAFLSPGMMSARGPLPLPGVPANRLPVLFRAGSEDRPGAYWLEQGESGELYLRLDPRRARETGAETIGNPAASPEQPSISSDRQARMTWLETMPSGQRELVAENPFGDQIRRPVSRSASSPAISISDNYVHLAWVEQSPESGDGSLYYWRAR